MRTKFYNTMSTAFDKIRLFSYKVIYFKKAMKKSGNGWSKIVYSLLITDAGYMAVRVGEGVQSRLSVCVFVCLSVL